MAIGLVFAAIENDNACVADIERAIRMSAHAFQQIPEKHGIGAALKSPIKKAGFPKAAASLRKNNCIKLLLG